MIKVKKTRTAKTAKKKKRNYTHPEEPRYACLSISEKHSSDIKSIRVVSYNIKFSQKIEKAVQLIKENEILSHADILMLQEMDVKGVVHIAHHLKYNYVYYPAVVHPLHNKDFGNAILSRWPLVDDHKIILPHLDIKKLQRITVGAYLHLNNKKIHLINVHLGIFLKAKHRRDQMLSVLESIRPGSELCIIAGDYNTFTKRNLKALLTSMEKADFQYATKEAGWSYKHWYFLNKKSALDHIFTKGIRILKAGRVKSNLASDHFPIWADVSLSE